MIRAMKAESAGAARLYDNSHRAAQAAQTREMILDALVRVMARGVADLSMPAVARESGVSLRTVYRHFPTKRDLLAALNVHLDARMGYSLEPLPRDLDELAANIRHYFWALDGMDATIRAAWSNPIAGEAREAAGLPLKLQAVADVLEPLTGSLGERERAHLFNTVSTLFSQYSLQRMKDDLGISADEAAESVVWAIKTLVDGAASASQPDPDRPRRHPIVW
jgi:AcrR family transcriptional regulator